jgi:hypothetical protein
LELQIEDVAGESCSAPTSGEMIEGAIDSPVDSILMIFMALATKGIAEGASYEQSCKLEEVNVQPELLGESRSFGGFEGSEISSKRLRP